MFAGRRYRVGSTHPAAVRYRNHRIVDLAHAVLSAIGTNLIPEREARAPRRDPAAHALGHSHPAAQAFLAVCQ